MKQIQAYIKPHKLNDVAMALQKVEGLRGMSIMDIRGFGRREEKDSSRLSIDDLIDFAKYVKIEIFCHEDLLDEVIGVIDKNAYTGLRGDGKIYVTEVVKAVKIGKGGI